MKLSYLLIICLFIIGPSVAITEEGKESVHAPYSSDELSEHDTKISTITGTAIEISKAEIDQDSSEKESLEYQGPKKTMFSEEPLKIIKMISPHRSDRGLRSGDLVKISVEIYPKNELNISIREFIDHDVPVFLSSVHGYILSDMERISFYKLGLLNDIECNKLDTCLANEYGNNYIKFVCNNNTCRICSESACEIDNYSKMPYLDDGEALFDLSTIKDGNLTDYPCLSQFVNDNINSINDTEINQSKIICSAEGNISIKIGKNRIMNINKSNSYLDDGWVVLSYKNNDSNGLIVHHLKLLDNDKIFDPGNSIAIDNLFLPAGSILVFWYYMLPNSPGTYNTETITSIDNPKMIISSPLDVSIVEDEPQFKVYRKFDQSRIFLQNELDIEYDVEYLGGSFPSVIKNIPVIFDTSPDDFNYTPYSNLSFEGTFYEDKSIPIKKKIKFTKEGMLSPPGIWINGRHFNFEENVEVDIPLIRYLNLISIISTVILFFIGIIIKDIFLRDAQGKDACIEWAIRKSRIFERGIGADGITSTIKLKHGLSRRLKAFIVILAFLLILGITMSILWLLGHLAFNL